RSPCSHMDRRNFFRRWWVWAALIVLALLVVPPLIRGNGGFTEVDTSKALAQINVGNFSKITVNDKQQTLDITLKSPVEGERKITASYPAQSADEIFSTIQAKAGGATYTTNVTQENTFVQLLLSLLPIAIVVFLLFLVMNQIQGGGSRVMNFGK